ncbi:hypothetical protein J4Q44_G00008070 [Coregonus suidteri]|uniref:Uncharacterized protein n=1 Tax=Coregonus suidteri TaxID=861788 RepID=A0AAN8MGK9_9TELE
MLTSPWGGEAALSDVERSFALLRFRELYWGPGQRIHHDTLTGYSDGGAHFSSGALEDLAFGPETLPPNQQDWIRVRELRGLRWGGSWGDVFLSILSKVYEELLPFQWCCIQSPLCHLYLAKTLLDRCQGYGWVSRLLHKSGQGNTGHCIFTLQRETGELETDGQVRRVPAVVRMAAFHQGIGKVKWRCAESERDWGSWWKMWRCGAPYLGQWRCTPGGCTWRVDGGDGGQQLAALVEVPQTFYSWTVGLLGFWSSNHTDDFLQSDGKLMIFPNITFPWRSVCTPLACPGTCLCSPAFLSFPIVTEPTVIRCKVKSTVHMQISAQDANTISFSLLFPRPPQAFVGKRDSANPPEPGSWRRETETDLGGLNRTGIDGAQVAEDKKPLILGLVLGIGIPFLLLLAALACICRSRKKTQGTVLRSRTKP